MAKRQVKPKVEVEESTEEVKPKVEVSFPKAWDELNPTEEVSIFMGGKDYKVSLDVAQVLIKKGKAKAK